MSNEASERLALVAELVRLRKAQGLSQTDVAKKMDIGQPAVSEFERSAGNLKIETLQKYAKALGVTIEITLRETGKVGNDE